MYCRKMDLQQQMADNYVVQEEQTVVYLTLSKITLMYDCMHIYYYV